MPTHHSTPKPFRRRLLDTRRRRRSALGLAAAAAALAVLAGCGDADDASAPPTTTAATTSTAVATSVPPAEPGPEPVAIDWHATFEAALPNGWAVRSCDGDRTHVCVHDAGRLLGDIELVAGYPLEDGQADLPPRDVATAWAADFVEHFRQDRSEGCPTFTFHADGPAPAEVLGRPGTRAAFTLTASDGTVVERVINHFVVVDGTVAIVNADAYTADGGCLGPSEVDPSFTPDRLAELEPHLDGLVASAPAPRP